MTIYGTEHQVQRAAWEPTVQAGVVACRRGPLCRADALLIAPDEPWDLGHPDAACPAPTAPEHRACNRGTLANYKAAATRRPEIHPALRDLDS